ncbi:MAG: hypothetical protein RLZZ371_2625 [Pseudomonadota bacterium]
MFVTRHFHLAELDADHLQPDLASAWFLHWYKHAVKRITAFMHGAFQGTGRRFDVTQFPLCTNIWRDQTCGFLCSQRAVPLNDITRDIECWFWRLSLTPGALAQKRGQAGNFEAKVFWVF